MFSEYSRRKFRDFVRLVQWGMDRLELDGGRESGGGQQVTNKVENVRNVSESMLGERKRKLMLARCFFLNYWDKGIGMHVNLYLLRSTFFWLIFFLNYKG